MVSFRWGKSARDELADLWLAAPSPQRKRITEAAYLIEQALRRDPEIGESREGDVRIFFQAPLGVLYSVDETARRVTVIQVWQYQ
jgi:hypothetical protein